MSQSCSSKSNFYIRNGMISQHRTLPGPCRDQLWGYWPPHCCRKCSGQCQQGWSPQFGRVFSLSWESLHPNLAVLIPVLFLLWYERREESWSGRDNKFLGWRITAHHRWMWVHLGLLGQVWTRMRGLQNAPLGTRPQMARECECWQTGFVKLWQYFCLVLLLHSKFTWGRKKQSLLNDTSRNLWYFQMQSTISSSTDFSWPEVCGFFVHLCFTVVNHNISFLFQSSRGIRN